MPYSLETCYVPSDSSDQFAALADTLDSASTEAQAAIDKLLADPKLATTLASFQDGVTAHNSILTSPDVSTVDALLNDIGALGFNATPRDYQKVTEAKGFMFLDSNLYLINQSDINSVTQHAPSSTYSVAGLGKGITDIDLDYLGVISSSGYNKSLVQKSGSYNQTAFKAAGKTSSSTTGTEYHVDGNVSLMREALRASGGDISKVKLIFNTGKSTGYAVVWSSVSTDEVSVDSSKMNDYDSIRSSYDYPVYDDQITFYPTKNVALVTRETFIGINISRDSAIAQVEASYKEKHGRTLTYTPSLFCRVFKFCVTNVLNSAPVFTTYGLDVSKLNTTSYSLGISISGYAIVLDVTGDRGTSTIGTYTAQSVASCITSQLGDILSVRVFGDEITFTAKVSGSSAFIQFFDTTYSAATALGIDGALSLVQSVVAKSSVKSTLADVKTIVIAGGSSNQADVSLSGSLYSDAGLYGFTTEQKQALVNGTYYWTALDSYSARSKAACATVLSDLEAEATAKVSVKTYLDDTKTALSLLGQDTFFMELTEIDVRLFDLFLAEFEESGLTSLLTQRINVYDISYNIPVSVGFAYLGQTLEKSALKSGTETTQSAVKYITAFHENISPVWKLYNEIDWLDMRSSELDKSEFVSELETDLGLATGVTYTASPVTSVGDSSSSTTNVGDFDLALRMQDPNWGNSILDAIAAASVVTIPAAWIKKAEGVVDRNLTNIENDITDWLDDKMSSLLSTLGLDADLAEAMRNYRRLLNGLKTITRVLKTATAFVQRQQQVYRNLLKIVNAGVNFQSNMYANFEINTKFVSCYASGSGSFALSAAFSKLVNALNAIIGYINETLEKLIKIIDKFFTILTCTIQALFSFFSATLSYSTTAAGAYSVLGVSMAVSTQLHCTISLGYTPDTTLITLLGQVQNQINALISSFHLTSITLHKQAETTDSLKTKVAGIGVNDLIAQFEQKLEALKNCI